MTDYAFRVDLAELEALIERMVAFEQHAESLCGDIDGEVNRLHGQWSGRAAEEHLEAHRRWRHGAAAMQRAAARLRHVATTAHGNYGAAVEANARMWS